MIRIFEFDALKPEEILNRDIRAEASVEATVDAIIADVRARGDAALKDYALKFDHAQLDELRYRQELWSHRPLTDFWRVGPGYAKKLEANYIMTMGDIARCSIKNEDFLYRLFGVNAELLIDHAWGYEPCTIALPSTAFVRGRCSSAPRISGPHASSSGKWRICLPLTCWKRGLLQISWC